MFTNRIAAAIMATVAATAEIDVEIRTTTIVILLVLVLVLVTASSSLIVTTNIRGRPTKRSYTDHSATLQMNDHTAMERCSRHL